MSDVGSRKNRTLLRWLIAIAFAAATYLTLDAMHFRPLSVASVASLAVGALALFSTEVATVGFVLIACLPLLAVNALAGLVFLVGGLAAVQYLGGNVIPVLLVIVAAVVGAVLGPVWAVPVLAGYVLGSTSGALAAFVACLLVEITGITVGGGWSSVVFLGGAHGFVSFAKTPANVVAFTWLLPALKSLGIESAKDLWTGLAAARHPAVLLLQPVAWALGAAVAGGLRRPADHPQQLPMSAAAVAAGVAIAAAGSVAALAAFDLTLKSGAILFGVVVSLALAWAGALIWDRAFKIQPRPVVRPAEAAAWRNMATEDADVDELLRLISSAEEKIAEQHTTTSVVMITDMKSFSRMTEEEGSFVTAKAVQRHRDLLLPVIEKHGGKGKSTGGDGLIASFETSQHGVAAGIEMQQTLQRYNQAHPREREILIRVGVAGGEVVLDKGGRPFIGAALNLAARVMSLGDGGQVLVTRDIASKVKDSKILTVSHGDFELKNIARPVEVVEILWYEGQAAIDPRSFFTPKPAAEEEAPREEAAESAG